MDPNSGKLYESMEAARKDGVEHPVFFEGRQEDIERISSMVKRGNRADRRAAKRALRKKNNRRLGDVS